MLKVPGGEEIKGLSMCIDVTRAKLGSGIRRIPEPKSSINETVIEKVVDSRIEERKMMPSI